MYRYAVRSASDLAEKGVKRGLRDRRGDEARGSVPESDCSYLSGQENGRAGACGRLFPGQLKSQAWRVAPILA
jgi:hypothetical protein